MDDECLCLVVKRLPSMFPTDIIIIIVFFVRIVHYLLYIILFLVINRNNESKSCEQMTFTKSAHDMHIKHNTSKTTLHHCNIHQVIYNIPLIAYANSSNTSNQPTLSQLCAFNGQLQKKLTADPQLLNTAPAATPKYPKLNAHDGHSPYSVSPYA